ncbi:cupin domain-containing protein [Sorangium sp. So ce315]|uniref:cupin domain-containing protein n=1 Tax=Sorangium sp. So ce315 TaxID=3133299 RepID=UPI003F5FB2DB
MPRPYRLVTSATRIPVPGGKLIEELFGRVNTGTDGFSLAHMVAPPGWSEPAQTPSFGELTLMIRGRMRVEIAGETIDLAAGQAIWTEADQRVRYSNPFDEESEYFALCIPAFAPDLARRDVG